MKPTPPPPDATPASLLALAKEWRPCNRIAFRFDAAPDSQLFVQAIQSSELVCLENAHERIARILVDSHGEQVTDAETLRLLEPSEWLALLADVTATTEKSCPTYRTHDVDRYVAMLQQAVKHDTTEAMRLWTCFDFVRTRAKNVMHPRPDRYWGKPASELLDLHLMLFQAAQRHFQK